MIVIPAMDLLQREVVRLEQGDIRQSDCLFRQSIGDCRGVSFQSRRFENPSRRSERRGTFRSR